MEIDDVRVIIRSGGKHYSLVPKKGIGPEVAKEARILLVEVLFEVMDVVDTPLEDLSIKKVEDMLGRPEWLTPEVEKEAKAIWDSHSSTEDHKRIEAVKYLRSKMPEHSSLKESVELFYKWVLKDK